MQMNFGEIYITIAILVYFIWTPATISFLFKNAEFNIIEKPLVALAAAALGIIVSCCWLPLSILYLIYKIMNKFRDSWYVYWR